jgi:hypothetical protein
MESLFAILVWLALLAAPVKAQDDSLTLHITQVIVTDKPETKTESTSTVNGRTVYNKDTLSTHGFEITGESETVRYNFSCSISRETKEMMSYVGNLDDLEATTETYVDGTEDSWETILPAPDLPKGVKATDHHGSTIFGTIHQYDTTLNLVNAPCENFHVGDTVKFVSLNYLAWRKITRGGQTLVHGKARQPIVPKGDAGSESSIWGLKDYRGLFHEREKLYTIESEKSLKESKRENE